MGMRSSLPHCGLRRIGCDPVSCIKLNRGVVCNTSHSDLLRYNHLRARSREEVLDLESGEVSRELAPTKVRDLPRMHDQHLPPRGGRSCPIRWCHVISDSANAKSAPFHSLHYGSRVSVALKFDSQVLPPSSENDCSKWCDVGVMSDQTCRTGTALPLNGS